MKKLVGAPDKSQTRSWPRVSWQHAPVVTHGGAFLLALLHQVRVISPELRDELQAELPSHVDSRASPVHRQVTSRKIKCWHEPDDMLS